MHTVVTVDIDSRVYVVLDGDHVIFNEGNVDYIPV
jgi:hypothetical protein